MCNFFLQFRLEDFHLGSVTLWPPGPTDTICGDVYADEKRKSAEHGETWGGQEENDQKRPESLIYSDV